MTQIGKAEGKTIAGKTGPNPNESAAWFENEGEILGLKFTEIGWFVSVPDPKSTGGNLKLIVKGGALLGLESDPTQKAFWEGEWTGQASVFKGTLTYASSSPAFAQLKDKKVESIVKTKRTGELDWKYYEP